MDDCSVSVGPRSRPLNLGLLFVFCLEAVVSGVEVSQVLITSTWLEDIPLLVVSVSLVRVFSGVVIPVSPL